MRQDLRGRHRPEKWQLVLRNRELEALPLEDRNGVVAEGPQPFSEHLKDRKDNPE